MSIVKRVEDTWVQLRQTFRDGAERGELQFRREVLDINCCPVVSIDRRIGELSAPSGLRGTLYKLGYCCAYYFPNTE